MNEYKVVTDGSFRSEEAIPPDTLMYFTWGTIAQSQENGTPSKDDFQQLLNNRSIIQFGGQESLGRGFIQQWTETQNSTPNGKRNEEVGK